MACWASWSWSSSSPGTCSCARPRSRSRPISGVAAASWEEAKARVAAIQAEEAADPTIVPECRTRLLDHGVPTAQVVVLFHGYTNCPKQYEKLAPELADRGYTVLVPRMPHHGIVPGTPGLSTA